MPVCRQIQSPGEESRRVPLDPRDRAGRNAIFTPEALCPHAALGSAAKAKAISAPQEVNGVEVKPVGTRNILVWVDSHASTAFQQRVDAALGALQRE